MCDSLVSHPSGATILPHVKDGHLTIFGQIDVDPY